MDLNNETILTIYKPLSPWAYYGYNILFSIPVIGFILLIVFSFSNDNINIRNNARSVFVLYALANKVILILESLGVQVGLYNLLK